MSKAIGGYFRRSERRYVPPVPDDGVPRCESCRARLDFVTPWNQPHICKEITYQSMPSLPPVIPFTADP